MPNSASIFRLSMMLTSSNGILEPFIQGHKPRRGLYATQARLTPLYHLWNDHVHALRSLTTCQADTPRDTASKRAKNSWRSWRARYLIDILIPDKNREP